ncbi:FAD binding domain-containing protein [Nocardioides sp. NPDC006303]|uniref:FAD binding domain-containing protein n=1 Tax=Nocardioides sp. NPDC006303 TaxID=3156747 RepID=UPI0033BC402B
MTRFHRPGSLEEATTLLSELDDAMVYGGGTAIQILLKQGILFTEDFLDISGVPGLNDVVLTDGGFRVGSLVSLRHMETSEDVRRLAPLVAQTYGKVANPRVRNTASVGGNVAHGDYRLDPPTALAVLDATLELSSVEGTREVSVREFFVDFQVTDLQPDEIITALLIPHEPPGSVGHYAKLSSLSENDWPCATAAVLAVPEDDFVEIRIGLGALAPTTRYVAFDMTPDMNDQETVEAAIEIADSAMDPIADVRGSASYKATLGRVAVEEAVRTVLKEINRD